METYLDLFDDVQCVLEFLAIGAEEFLDVWSWHGGGGSGGGEMC